MSIILEFTPRGNNELCQMLKEYLTSNNIPLKDVRIYASPSSSLKNRIKFNRESDALLIKLTFPLLKSV